MSVQVTLRQVEDGDLDILYEQQRDPEAVRMMAFPARSEPEFAAHWARVRANPSNLVWAIEADGELVGSIGSWEMEGQREVGLWHRTGVLGARDCHPGAAPGPGAAAASPAVWLHCAAQPRLDASAGEMRLCAGGPVQGVLNVDGELVDELVFRLD